MKPLTQIWLGAVLLINGLIVGQAWGQHDLVGRISNDAGQPLAGASVIIYQATPRVGIRATDDPSLFPDCKKSATSDENGQFVVAGLDATLLFDVLVAAPGYQPTLAYKVDPVEKPLEVKLKPLPTDRSPQRMMTGRVVDEEGQPVFGATVWVTAAGNRFGAIRNVDGPAVTNENGEFLLTASEDFESWGLNVVARHFAFFQSNEQLELGDHKHTITIQEGVVVTGIVRHDGQPVANHIVSIYTTGRISRTATAKVEAGFRAGQPFPRRQPIYNQRRIATDEDGHFEFIHVIPELGWYIYSDHTNDPARGAVVAEEFDTNATGTNRDLGVFDLKPMFRVSGRIEMEDGSEVPSDFNLRAALDFGRASYLAILQPDGSFEFPALPQDQLQMYLTPIPGPVFVPGKRQFQFVSGKQQLQQTDPRYLKMRVTKEIEDLKIVITPESKEK